MTALAILKEADDVVGGVFCDCSTDCCRFAVTGREPWLTRSEFDVVASAVKASGKKLPQPRASHDGRCAFLADDDKCAIYAARPLGCRTFFCDKNALSAQQTKELRALPRRLAELTPREESKPLHAWLKSALSTTPEAKRQKKQQRRDR